MAASPTKSVILTIIFASLCMQATALPLLIRLILEPGIIDARIRAAAVLNKAGFGFGGFLTKSGELIHWFLSEIGEDVNRRLNKIGKLFTSPDESHDDDSSLGIMKQKMEEREKEKKRKEALGELDKEKIRQEIIEKGRPSKYHDNSKRNAGFFKFIF